MKQVSLLDSFMRKQKIKEENNSQQKTQEKNPQIKYQQKISVGKPSDSNSIESTIQAEKKLEKLSINNPVEISEFIAEDQFGFQEVKGANGKKRKMNIDDQSDGQTPQHFRAPVEQIYETGKRKSKAKSKSNIKFASESENEVENDRSPAFNRGESGKRFSETHKRETEGPERQGEDEFTDSTPEWATPENCKDAKGRRPGHPEYDGSTLFIPPQALKGMTETMRQYWRIKSENFDKIILFKLGKFYQLFYQDAAIGNKHLDLKWMGTKMHVGFPEKVLDKYAHEFVSLGFRIVIVEQLQTPQQMKERMKTGRQEGVKSQKTLLRGVTQVLTKGTIISFQDQSQYLPNYLISVSKQGPSIAYALLEMSNNQLLLGLATSIEDFKTVLFQTRPVEFLYDPDNLPNDLVDLMKKNWLQMLFTRLPNKDNIWHPMNAKNQLESLVKAGALQDPRPLKALQNLGPDNEKLVYGSLSGLFRYLKNCFKLDYILSAIKLGFYEGRKSGCMVLDSQALQHLEIFETPLGEKDSLFARVDRTSTKFGKRLFRRWMMQPLLSPNLINHRLDAVQDLQGVSNDRARLAQMFSRLPDLQKIVNRLYHYSVKTIAEKAIYFQDISASRLKEFRSLIQHFNKAWNALELLRKNKNRFNSVRLVHLLTLQGEGKNQQQGMLPFIRGHLQEFESYIKWEGDLPVPQKGLVSSYDALQQQLSECRGRLQRYIEGVRFSTGVASIKFVHTKERFQMEIPESMQKKRLSEMIFTSKRSGFSRYVTDQSRRLVSEVQSVQSQIKEQMGLFVGFFFQQFRKKQRIWEKFIGVLSEIDCLVGISIYSSQSLGVRPQFDSHSFRMDGAKHPCLKASDVIANDINLQQARVMLLTGPNMGGKSTLLRTTCVLSILAQIGAFVTADYYNCEPIDRIFTRIGASDKLEEGKSTFFIEMEETKSLLRFGTARSLAIIDELGRGTSTFDGMAIAYSVLRDIVERVHCRTIFATHYHSLSRQFQGISAIRLKMMDYLLSDDKIIFLYKLRDGSAGQSFGLNVARIVKIPVPILEQAPIHAAFIEQQIAQKDRMRKFKQALAFASN